MAPETVRELAATRSAATWEWLFGRTEAAARDVDRNVEPRLAVEALFAEAMLAGAPG
jgi:hypothetical protein